VPASSFTLVNDTTITAVVPAEATTGPVSVTTPSGPVTGPANLTIFQAVAGISPTTGAPGTTVAVTGSGFTGATAVAFNGVRATSFTVVNDSTITAVVPNAATTGPVSVTTPGVTAASSGNFTVTQTAPTITTTSLPNATLNAAYSTTVQATGSAPITFSALGLPSGLSINPGTGAITGTPTQTGTFAVTVTAANSISPKAITSLALTVGQLTTGSQLLVGYRELGVGADAGGGSATLYNPDESVRYAVNPFGSGYSGGVRVAAADFNGDGIADLVVGTGPGVATLVLILDGKDEHQLFSINPFESTFTGGVYVAAGDVNGDGVPDLVITPDQGGGPRVRVIDGKTFGLIADFFGISDPNFGGGARAAVGDVNGDGVGDLVVAAGFGGGPRVAVFNGTTLAGNNPTRLFNDFFAFEQTLRNGVFIAAGDLEGTGKADLVAGGGPGGGPRVTAFSAADLIASGGGTLTPVANFFGGDPNNRGGIRIAVKDLDGDNKADLVVGSGTGAGSHVTAYLGKNISPTGVPGATLDFDAFSGFSGGVFVG
jgi:trimeric autotransporter adhesin